jgi:hypothetical protein
MCGLNALRLGWLITCWGTLVVVVGEPTPVVVVEPPTVVVVVVVVVVVDCANAAEPVTTVNPKQSATAAVTAPATRDRAARERPERNHRAFMPATECECMCREL